MRLNRFIAQAGIASRRGADELISKKRVQINGKFITDFSFQVQESDRVEVNGKSIHLSQESVILALYKPRGVTTTKRDPHAKKTVMDLLPERFQDLHPVGRLDKDSEGLILLTNDGQLTYTLTHPSQEHEKEYEVHTAKPISDQALQKLAKGVLLEEGWTAPTSVQRLEANAFSLILHQGWKRQIRRMVEQVENHVTLLKRIRIERLSLGNLQPREFRQIQRSDIIDV